MGECEFKTIGFIGLGAMGGPMARSLVRAGFEVWGYDTDPIRLSTAKINGVQAAENSAAVILHGEVICTSLPNSDTWVKVVEEEFLPMLAAGKIIIDLGTVAPPETRAMARRLSMKGVTLLDVPVSGGTWGAENSLLYMFAAGDEEVFERCLPILQAIGGPEQITYCGAVGSGQVVKGVNQLMMALSTAAYLEAMSLGVNAGVDAEIIRQAMGNRGRFRQDFNVIASQVVEGQGGEVGVKFRELPYYLREAADGDFQLPLTKALYALLDKGKRVVVDDNLQAPSLWYELVIKRNKSKE